MKQFVIVSTTTFVFFMSILSLNAQDQKGFYVKPAVSYFFKVTPVEFPNVGSLQPRETVLTINPSTGASTVVSEKTITGSFGQGLRAGAAVGYRFNDVVALELAANYFQSTGQTMAKQSATAGTTNVLSLESIGKATAIDLAPALVLSIPTKNKLKPYVRTGFILPVYGYLEINSKVTDLTGAVAATLNPAFKAATIDRTERVKPTPTIGFVSGLGLEMAFSDRISLTTELEYRNVSVGSKSKEITAFAATGTLATGAKVAVGLSDLPDATKNVVYQEELTTSSNVSGRTGFDATKDGNDLKSYINIGGLGVSIGLKIKL
jgi:opacity protein-like surface antigen